jgi:hypothetical protein
MIIRCDVSATCGPYRPKHGVAAVRHIEMGLFDAETEWSEYSASRGVEQIVLNLTAGIAGLGGV